MYSSSTLSAGVIQSPVFPAELVCRIYTLLVYKAAQPKNCQTECHDIGYKYSST